jgi:hypothetical protein
MILHDPDATDPNAGTAGYYMVEAAVALVGPGPPAERAAGVMVACAQAAWFGDFGPGWPEARAEEVARAALLRCVVCNPSRLAAFDLRWRTADVLGLARGIYEDRAFDRLPLLADALMDAGCDDDQVLGHCRSPGPHARGCWVVDLALGFA